MIAVKKLFRTAWRYTAHFISMVIMVAIGTGIFLGFNMEWKNIEADTGAFFAAAQYADFRCLTVNVGVKGKSFVSR